MKISKRSRWWIAVPALNANIFAEATYKDWPGPSASYLKIRCLWLIVTVGFTICTKKLRQCKYCLFTFYSCSAFSSCLWCLSCSSTCWSLWWVTRTPKSLKSRTSGWDRYEKTILKMHLHVRFWTAFLPNFVVCTLNIFWSSIDNCHKWCL